MLGDFGEVYVLDWGLAKLHTHAQVDGPRSADTKSAAAARPELAPDVAPEVAIEHPSKTEAGRILGTLGYIAPEQAAELDAPVDGRADIFALGVMLFELLTLKRLRPSLPSDQMFRIIHEGVDSRPSVRAPEAEVPPELEAICVRATSQQPADRYATARELHDAIQNFLAGARDLELRRQLATRHMEKAALSAQKALLCEGDARPSRQAALQDLGRVLALDPSNTQALELLYQLLTKPPAEMPPEIAQALQDAELERERMPLRMASRIALVLCIVLLLMLYMGVRNWWLFGLGCVCLPPLVTIRVIQLREKKPRGWLRLLALAAHLIVYAILARMFGPLVFVTLPMAMFGVISSSTADHRYRNLVLASTSLLVVGMVALEYLRILPPSYIFHDGMMTIVPHLSNLVEGPCVAMLLIVSLASIILPALSMGQLPQRAHELHRQNLLQNWQLSQLIPK